jgi:hypothetical protein
MRTLHNAVEGPSPSPDDPKIVVKRRHSSDHADCFVRGPHVQDLASGIETALMVESRNVADQVE